MVSKPAAVNFLGVWVFTEVENFCGRNVVLGQIMYLSSSRIRIPERSGDGGFRHKPDDLTIVTFHKENLSPLLYRAMQSPKNIDVLLAGVTFVAQGTPGRWLGEDALSGSQVGLCKPSGKEPYLRRDGYMTQESFSDDFAQKFLILSVYEK
jgi:hypothetical protein